MKIFYKLNIASLLLGVMFYLLITFFLKQYDIQQTLHLSNEMFAIFSVAFYLIIIICISIFIPRVSIEWLKGSNWSVLLTILWIPYFIIVTFLVGKFFELNYKTIENDYIAEIILMVLSLGFPIYIFILSFMGIAVGKSSK